MFQFTLKNSCLFNFLNVIENTFIWELHLVDKAWTEVSLCVSVRSLESIKLVIILFGQSWRLTITVAYSKHNP